jgi:hypothetical protein
MRVIACDSVRFAVVISQRVLLPDFGRDDREGLDSVIILGSEEIKLLPSIKKRIRGESSSGGRNTVNI